MYSSASQSESGNINWVLHTPKISKTGAVEVRPLHLGNITISHMTAYHEMWKCHRLGSVLQMTSQHGFDYCELLYTRQLQMYI